MLRRVPLSVQKDAVMVAVLRRHGGVFLDADTLAVRDIAPLVALLDRSEVLTFDMHLAFMAAQPGARLLERWLPAIQRRLAALRGAPPAEIPWDYLGNNLFYSTMDEIIDAHAGKPLAMAVADHAIGLARRLSARRGRMVFARLVNAGLWRRRRLAFRTICRARLTMLDRDRYGFMPERLHNRGRRGALADEYRRYWFESSAGVDSALREGQMLIGLHNSWTPDWYKRLEEAEVLGHPCLLSRTLRRLLDR